MRGVGEVHSLREATSEVPSEFTEHSSIWT